MYRSFAGSHGLGSRDFDVEYELFNGTSRIRTFATVIDGRVIVDDSLAFVLDSRFPDVVEF